MHSSSRVHFVYTVRSIEPHTFWGKNTSRETSLSNTHRHTHTCSRVTKGGGNTSLWGYAYLGPKVCIKTVSFSYSLHFRRANNGCWIKVCMLSHSAVSGSLRPQWTIDLQAPLSMGFPRKEPWSGLPFPPPGDLPHPGIELMSPESPTLAGRFLTTEPAGKSWKNNYRIIGSQQTSK